MKNTINQFENLPFHYKIQQTHPGGGEWKSGWIEWPLFDLEKNKLQRILFTLAPVGAGEGRIEITDESSEEIKNNLSDILYTAWPAGNISAKTRDDVAPITAFQLVIISGTMRLSARGI